MTFLLLYWKHLLAVALLAVVVLKIDGCGYDRGFNVANARADKIVAKLAKAEAASLARARAAERGKALALNQADHAYQKGLTDAKQLAAATVAGLRAGNLQLRDYWQGCINRLPSTAPGTGEPDAASGLRAESAGRIVQAVAECQAQRDGLQAVTQADRK